jgi:hypothetical protein
VDLIEFEWLRCIDGFRIYDGDDQDDLTKYGGFESASSRFERYRPADFPALFQRFADVPHSTEGIGEFVNRFGLLEMDRIPRSTKMIRVSTLAYSLLGHHRRLRWAISRYEAGDARAVSQFYNKGRDPSLGQVRTELRIKPTGRVSLVFVPSNLIEFLWLQFALHIISEAKLLRCERCGLPFPCGTGTRRRETAKFCSDRCRVASFRDRKAAAEATKRGRTAQKSASRRWVDSRGRMPA